MKTENKKFLEFNGKNVYFLSMNGVWAIAIKPICEALKVDYSRQLRTLKGDDILGQLWSLETIVAADGRLRKMVCLPEKFIYGWIFGLQSDSPGLKEFKKECYEVLYDHFHGAISSRTGLLKEKTAQEIEIERLETELRDNPVYQRIQDLKKGKQATNRALKVNDSEIIKNQLPLWNSVKAN